MPSPSTLKSQPPAPSWPPILPSKGPLRELGFVPEVHYFPMRDEDLEDRVRYLLREENHPALDHIRRNDQALVSSAIGRFTARK